MWKNCYTVGRISKAPSSLTWCADSMESYAGICFPIATRTTLTPLRDTYNETVVSYCLSTIHVFTLAVYVAWILQLCIAFVGFDTHLVVFLKSPKKIAYNPFYPCNNSSKRIASPTNRVFHKFITYSVSSKKI